ncbi:transaldolase [Luminiphilus syltensis NOR5-1B]|uniref:Transaldolase n=1 Tax=Luminiphilus syltensis NOR5-1B TaxID=565045 RepID=B8KXM1_9GAMM|nr:transaldolase [Luminiphilus syltensis]EED36623.1 transaldolase [Luminiphilus syltensis NOR5-1B]
MNKLEQLRAMTEVVADTGEIDAIARLQPIDATTNPSLLLKTAQLPRFSDLLDRAIAAARSAADACDQFAVIVGGEILNHIPGRVSTEVDARLSFDTQATIAKAHRLIELYDHAGIDKKRILIKIAATWEGICAARELEREGINCNLTLLFGFAQAQACADAGAFLISPFVGRILDWHLANTDLVVNTPFDDPGVRSVTRIYEHYKNHGYETVVMGASFRNSGEIEALAGCDRLTISPALMDALAEDNGHLPRALATAGATQQPVPAIEEADFRYQTNDDAMASDKLADGIRRFAADQQALESLLAAKITR